MTFQSVSTYLICTSTSCLHNNWMQSIDKTGPERAVPRACRSDPDRPHSMGDSECFSRGSKSYDRQQHSHPPLPAIALFARLQSLHRLSRPFTRPIKSYQPHTPIASYSERISIARSDLPRATVNMPTTLKEFEAVFPKLVADLKQHCEQYKLPTQALKWFEEVGHSP